jgi:hypothetical protein
VGSADLYLLPLRNWTPAPEHFGGKLGNVVLTADGKVSGDLQRLGFFSLPGLSDTTAPFGHFQK